MSLSPQAAAAHLAHSRTRRFSSGCCRCRIDEFFADGTLSGGMLSKIAGALDAARSGVNAVPIIYGRVPHVQLLEVLTDQAYGRMIRWH